MFSVKDQKKTTSCCQNQQKPQGNQRNVAQKSEFEWKSLLFFTSRTVFCEALWSDLAVCKCFTVNKKYCGQEGLQKWPCNKTEFIIKVPLSGKFLELFFSFQSWSQWWGDGDNVIMSLSHPQSAEHVGFPSEILDFISMQAHARSPFSCLHTVPLVFTTKLKSSWQSQNQSGPNQPLLCAVPSVSVWPKANKRHCSDSKWNSLNSPTDTSVDVLMEYKYSL